MKGEIRIKILNAIFSEFQQMTQWLPNSLDFAVGNMHSATSLIEFLEVEDCGSTGGFDVESPVILNSGFKLYDRFIALVHKYDNATHIKPVCGFNINNLTQYFKQLSNLRETILNQ